MKPTPDFVILLNQFNEALRDCRAIYIDGGQQVVTHFPHLLAGPQVDFLNMMDDLHRGLMLKLFVEIAGTDGLYTEAEEHLAGVLFFHLWHRQMGKTEIRESLRHLVSQSSRVRWRSVVRPFAETAPLRYRIPELETVIVRLGNLIARSDGRATSMELDSLKAIQSEIFGYLNGAAPRPPEPSPSESAPHTEYAQQRDGSAGAFPDSLMRDPASQAGSATASDVQVPQPSRPGLEETLQRLQKLIGLDDVKNEVRSMVNFLKVQRSRDSLGLPANPVSLHMVFTGNPGTGKTTVARIVGEIYAAMGLLEKGHLIETDRAGLVAEYAGQTAIKTDRLIDQALGGVLFIDEAYSLASTGREDPYGNEAVQKLLKRMEDDRERLAVILAGYPDEMDRLLKSNPGLSSRFPNHIEFADYSPVELARIFETMCADNHYRIQGLTRSRLLSGFEWLFDRRDRHFGNGRTVRNLFERAIRRLADRVASLPDMTRDLLTKFDAADIAFENVPPEQLDLERLAMLRYSIECPGCETTVTVESKLLGRRVECKRCRHRFRIDWAAPGKQDATA